MKKLFIYSLSLLLLVTSNTSFAEPIKQQTLDKLIEKSGLPIATKQLPSMVNKDFRDFLEYKLNYHLTFTDRINLEKAVNDSFSNEHFLSNIKDQIKQGISEQDAEYLLKWYESNAGMKIVQAETSNNWKRQYLHKEIKDHKKKQLINDLSIHMGTSERIKIYQNLILLAAVRNFTCDKIDLSTPEMKKELSHQYQRIVASVKNQLSIYYRDIDNHSLESFLNFHKNSVAKIFSASLSNGIKVGFDKANLRFSKITADSYKNCD